MQFNPETRVRPKPKPSLAFRLLVCALISLIAVFGAILSTFSAWHHVGDLKVYSKLTTPRPPAPKPPVPKRPLHDYDYALPRVKQKEMHLFHNGYLELAPLVAVIQTDLGYSFALFSHHSPTYDTYNYDLWSAVDFL